MYYTKEYVDTLLDIIQEQNLLLEDAAGLHIRQAAAITRAYNQIVKLEDAIMAGTSGGE